MPTAAQPSVRAAPTPAGLRGLVSRYRTPSLPRSLWQLGVSVALFFACCGLMWLTVGWSYPLTLALAVPAALFLVRLFVIHHDCGHGSFFRARWANDWVGRGLGLLTLTPYDCWRKCHAIHHAHVGKLHRRGDGGDIPSLTVAEYEALPPWKQLGYRLFRNPVFLFGVFPTVLFVVVHRLPVGVPRSRKKERASIYWTNLALLAGVLGLSWLVGFVTLLLIAAPVVVLASSVGVWLFYVQHQFEEAYWEAGSAWDFEESSLAGSSYYRLPAVLEWLTASIGIHHIHHLDSAIPNYRLRRCLDENPQLRGVRQLTLWASLGCVRCKLWDEQKRRMVGFPRKDKARRMPAPPRP